MMKKLPHLSERGSISLVTVFILMTVSALLIFSFSSDLTSINKLHSRQQRRLNFKPHMHRLAKLFHQAYILAQMDSSCGGATLSLRNINGINFCFSSSTELCIQDKHGDKILKYCASSDASSLQWKNAFGSTIIGQQKESSVKVSESSLITSNRISIPSTTDQSLWRSCNPPSSCVRLILCPVGEISCQPDEALASQIIRLGALE